MKKLILVFAAIGFSVVANAQTDSVNKKMRAPDINKTNDGMNQNRDLNSDRSQNVQSSPVEQSHPDGVMMQEGRMRMVKDGKMTLLDQTITMTNGTKIMSDGTCVKRDGTKSMFKEGEHMDMAGNMIPMKNSTPKIK